VRPHDTETTVDVAELTILEQLFARRHEAPTKNQVAAPWPFGENATFETYQRAYENVRVRGWVVEVPFTPGEQNPPVFITRSGIQELFRRYGLATAGEFADLRHQVEVSREASHGQLHGLGERLAVLDKNVAEIQRDFFKQAVPLFALAVSVFALLITGSQAVPAPGLQGFGENLAASAGRLIPLACLYLIVIAGTLGIANYVSRKPDDS
jgi:hypothetical protein